VVGVLDVTVNTGVDDVVAEAHAHDLRARLPGRQDRRPLPVGVLEPASSTRARPSPYRSIPAVVSPPRDDLGLDRAAEVQLEVAVGDAATSPISTSRPRSRSIARSQKRWDGGHVVRDEQDGRAAAAQAGELVVALLLEGGVAHREDLVDEQDLGVDLDHHREGEATSIPEE
jgi:hypothetical protein